MIQRLSDIKRDARLALHGELGEPCVYHDRDLGALPSSEQSGEGLILTARFATKLKTVSPVDDGLSILEGIERLTFQQPQLDALGIPELDSGSLVEFPGYGLSFRLDQPMDADGPLNVYWTVTRA